ncbi:MAG: DNA gyrase subunit B, partial [bacterium]|nr:DNA gyrase subunit B [bacterium]
MMKTERFLGLYLVLKNARIRVLIMADKELKKQEYTAKDIQVLEGLEPVRKRPGMYIGSTGIDGLHHLIWEVFDNSLDEAMAGHASHIEVALLADNKVRVSDDGRGIPTDIHPKTKKSALETAATTLHAGGKFEQGAYKVSGGLHGVGLSVVNALSTWMKAEVYRKPDVFAQEYKIGKPQGPVKKVGTTKKTGTTITFQPDPTIFPDITFDITSILNHIRQQAYLTKGVKITVTDARAPLMVSDGKGKQVEAPLDYTFYFEGGIMSYVDFLNHGEEAKNKNIFYIGKEQQDMFVEVALQYVEDLTSRELSFANNIHTIEGGTHLTGFRSALTRILNDYARKNGFLKEKEDNLSGEDVREGLTVVISIKLREPQFEGQTKAKLGTTEARNAIETVMNAEFTDWLERNPNDAREILDKVILASKARLAAKAARDTVLRKGALEGMTLPGKLADCSSRDASESELFIVEGDSAGGSSKQARNRHTQAILPLRGKILNVEKARLDKMLASQEIRNLIIAMGTAIAEEFDLSKLRYHKIVIMTDADVDGAHIRTLLLTLFYRYFPQVIAGGHLYIAQPPLYKVQKGTNIHYAYNDIEKDKIIEEFRKVAGEK